MSASARPINIASIFDNLKIYFEINRATIVGSIHDASNCFNINSLVRAGKEDYQENKKSMNVFRELMYLTEVDNNVAEEIIDQIIDLSLIHI